jgi:hypothetical protein
MGFNFSLTDAAAQYGLDFFNLVGANSIFGVIQDAQASYIHPSVPQGSFYVSSQPSAMAGFEGYTLRTSFLATGPGTFSFARYTVTRTDTGEVILDGTGRLPDAGSVSLQSLEDANNLLAGDDTITGNAGNNQLRGFAGINTVNGGAGLDTLLMPQRAHQLYRCEDRHRPVRPSEQRQYHHYRHRTTAIRRPDSGLRYRR